MKTNKHLSHHETVEIIRAYSDDRDSTYSTLAERFGVCPDAIRKTVTGVTAKGRLARDQYELERVLRRIGAAMNQVTVSEGA